MFMLASVVGHGEKCDSLQTVAWRQDWTIANLLVMDIIGSIHRRLFGACLVQYNSPVGNLIISAGIVKTK